MNYQKIYNSLIDRARNCACHGYSEKHHIIPKCLGGTNHIDNIVELRPEEHYTAHLLLAKIYPNDKRMIFAAHRMTNGKNRNNKLYGWVRRQHAEAMSELHSGVIRGTPSVETKTKMSISQQLRLEKEKEEGIKRGCPSPFKNRIYSDEEKREVYASRRTLYTEEEKEVKYKSRRVGKGNGKPQTEETKRKLSEIGKNQIRKPHSEETKRKMSLSRTLLWQKKKLQ